jgi:hypothetical protein
MHAAMLEQAGKGNVSLPCGALLRSALALAPHLPSSLGSMLPFSNFPFSTGACPKPAAVGQGSGLSRRVPAGQPVIHARWVRNISGHAAACDGSRLPPEPSSSPSESLAGYQQTPAALGGSSNGAGTPQQQQQQQQQAYSYPPALDPSLVVKPSSTSSYPSASAPVPGSIASSVAAAVAAAAAGGGGGGAGGAAEPATSGAGAGGAGGQGQSPSLVASLQGLTPSQLNTLAQLLGSECFGWTREEGGWKGWMGGDSLAGDGWGKGTREGVTDCALSGPLLPLVPTSSRLLTKQSPISLLHVLPVAASSTALSGAPAQQAAPQQPQQQQAWPAQQQQPQYSQQYTQGQQQQQQAYPAANASDATTAAPAPQQQQQQYGQQPQQDQSQYSSAAQGQHGSGGASQQYAGTTAAPAAAAGPVPAAAAAAAAPVSSDGGQYAQMDSQQGWYSQPQQQVRLEKRERGILGV